MNAKLILMIYVQLKLLYVFVFRVSYFKENTEFQINNQTRSDKFLIYSAPTTIWVILISHISFKIQHFWNIESFCFNCNYSLNSQHISNVQNWSPQHNLWFWPNNMFIFIIIFVYIISFQFQWSKITIRTTNC